MAELSPDGDDRWSLQLSRLEKFGALKRSNPSFAMANVKRVQWMDDPSQAVRGIRVPGTSIPGRIALGTWRGENTVDFVAVFRREPGYLIELEDEPFTRFIVSSPRIPEFDALL